MTPGDITYEREPPSVTRADLVGLRELVNSRFDNVNLRIDGVKDAVRIAFTASEKANAKTERSQNSWNDTHNNLIRQMEQQRQHYVAREIFDKAMQHQTEALVAETIRADTKIDAVTRLVWIGVGIAMTLQLVLGVSIGLLILMRGS